LVQTYGGNLSTINVSDFVFSSEVLGFVVGKQIVVMYTVVGQQTAFGFGDK